MSAVNKPRVLHSLDPEAAADPGARRGNRRATAPAPTYLTDFYDSSHLPAASP